MEVLISWLILAAGVAWWAAQWGRSAFGWFLVAVILSPLLGAIGLAVRGRADRPPRGRA